MSAVNPAHSAAARAPEYEPFIRLYVWDVWVRLCHWIIAFSILILSVTGVYIGDPYLIVPGQAGQHFVMGWMKVIHFYAAIAFTLAVLARVLWMLVGPRRAGWRELIPVEKERLVGIFLTIQFYLWGRDTPPRSPGHNPLAGATYIAVFALYFVMITTGLGLYALSAHVDSPLRIFDFLAYWWGGPMFARWVHHIVMWLLIGFFVHHVFSALLISAVKKNGTMESIFSGFKWVHPDEAKREAERWARRK
ncbi:MAG: Ni/Fe-hydrogenase, b-type cytochrome subunit [Deltaproteobacteria bacterium]|nr:Ni/Fe-hydrogenase, b-type cytochrome subunit [Deltaproteobacteria bacterium]